MKKFIVLTLLALFIGTGSVHAQGTTFQDLYNRLNNLLKSVSESRQALPASTAYLLDSQVDSVNTTITELQKTQTDKAKPLGYSFAKIISTTAKGAEVEKLQTTLKSYGFYNGPIDGKFGKGTIAAVKAFQAANGIQKTGSVGPKTLQKLNEIAAKAGICAADQPQTIVITPAGAETFKVGGKIPFRWIACNTATVNTVAIVLENQATKAQSTVVASTPNDGTETVIVGSEVALGKYKAAVSYNGTAGKWSSEFTIAAAN